MTQITLFDIGGCFIITFNLIFGSATILASTCSYRALKVWEGLIASSGALKNIAFKQNFCGGFSKFLWGFSKLQAKKALFFTAPELARSRYQTLSALCSYIWAIHFELITVCFQTRLCFSKENSHYKRVKATDFYLYFFVMWSRKILEFLFSFGRKT